MCVIVWLLVTIFLNCVVPKIFHCYILRQNQHQNRFHLETLSIQNPLEIWYNEKDEIRSRNDCRSAISLSIPDLSIAYRRNYANDAKALFPDQYKAVVFNQGSTKRLQGLGANVLWQSNTLPTEWYQQILLEILSSRNLIAAYLMKVDIFVPTQRLMEKLEKVRSF